MKNENKEWLHEYGTFLNADKATVPAEVTENIMNQMRALLTPSPWIVFSKILGIHLVVGFFSLSICHQFGMNPFGTETSLANWMMSVGGHNACMFGCGLLFVSLSLLAATLVLTVEEVRALKKTELRQNLALGLISLGVFLLAGAPIALSIGALWLLGAVVGGFVATEAALKFKCA